jgi:hypothetical protein
MGITKKWTSLIIIQQNLVITIVERYEVLSIVESPRFY